MRRFVSLSLWLAICLVLPPPTFGWDEPPESPTKDNSAPLEFGPGGATGGLFNQLVGGTTTGDELTLSAEFRVAENGRDGSLAVKAILAKGWHVYSLTQPSGGPIASKLSVGTWDQFSVKGPFQANHLPEVRSVKEFKVPVEEHSGEVIWTAPVRFAPYVNFKELIIPVQFDGQVCTDGTGEAGGSCIPKSNLLVSAKYAEGNGALPKETGIYRAKGGKASFEGSVDKRIVAPGSKVTLSITAKPDDDWYVYALEARDPDGIGSKPTLIVVTESGGLNEVRQSAATAPKVKETGVKSRPLAHYHTDPITWRVELSVPQDAKPGPREIRGFIGYQTCLKDQCEFPQVAAFRAQVEVGATDTAETMPLEIRDPPPPSGTGAKPVNYEAVAKLAKDRPAPAGIDVSALNVANPSADISLAWVLPIAILGGFILNFMPCVLPVIGLKILSFVQQAGESRARIFSLNLVYSAGMLAVFMVLATLAVVWNLGWGEQNNNDVFNIVMIAVIFTMGLSFLGVWEIPIPGFVGSGKASELAQKEGPIGAFFKGAITTLLATPCSGPGLATALAWCNGKPPHLVYLVFACLGLGMALPYLVIGAFPALVRAIPKPGAWMETFKQMMGFVLFGTVVFMFTYLSALLFVPTLALLIALWAACWWIGRTPSSAELSQMVRAWVGGAAFAGLVGWLAFFWLAGTSEHKLPWQPFSINKLESLTAENKTVLVDFTADWCLTCKALEANVLNTKKVKNAVEQRQVETLVADWTTKDPQIGELLNKLGSKQIPVLAIFPAGRPNKPIVLIGGYTQATLLKRIEEATAAAAPGTENATAMK